MDSLSFLDAHILTLDEKYIIIFGSIWAICSMDTNNGEIKRMYDTTNFDGANTRSMGWDKKDT